MRKITKRSAAIATGAVLAVAGGTAAFAYATGWFQGTSTVTATSSDIKPIQVSASLGGTKLWPGKTVTVPAASVTNTNDYPVEILSIKDVTVSSPNKQGCGTSQAGLTFSALPPSQTLAAGQTKAISLGKITMSKDALPVCANADLVISANLEGGIWEAAPAAPGNAG